MQLNLSQEELNEIEKLLDLNIDQLISSYVFKEQKNIDELLKTIQNKYKLKNFPYKIVCLDISHTSGKNPVGGLSAMVGGILTKKNYRQFKIPQELGGNDYESLKFCINKYFQTNTCDLFILDGGKGQLNIIYDLDNKILEKVDFLALGKGKARKRKGKIEGFEEKIYTPKGEEIALNPDLLEDKLLIKLRDEAHRFANKYRKKLEKI